MRSLPMETVHSRRSTQSQPAEGRPGPSDYDDDDNDDDNYYDGNDDRGDGDDEDESFYPVR